MAPVRPAHFSVEIDGPTPPPGTPILAGDKDAGVMRSATDGLGLALLRLEYLEPSAASPLTAGEARLSPRKPDWAAFWAALASATLRNVPDFCSAPLSGPKNSSLGTARVSQNPSFEEIC